MKITHSALIILTIGCNAAFFCATGIASSYTAEDFADFLHSPPKAESLVFERHRGTPPDVRTQYFDVTWQPGAFLIRNADSIDEFSITGYTDNQIYGHYDGFTWYFMLSGNKLVLIDKNGRYVNNYVPVDVDGEPGHTAKHLQRRAALQLSPVLNLGVLAVKPGTVSCVGNTFHAVDVNDRQIAGDFILRNNVVKGLMYAVHDGDATYRWAVEYTFGKSRDWSEVLPKTIEIFVVDDDTKRSYITINISTFKTPENGLQREQFFPDRFIEQGKTRYFYQAGSTLYRVDGDKLAALSSGGEDAPNEGPRWMAVAAFAVVTFAFAVAYWRVKTNNNQRKAN